MSKTMVQDEAEPPFRHLLMAFSLSKLLVIALLWFLSVATFSTPSSAQTLSPSNLSAARSLDALLQDYAYRAFNKPRTGQPYQSAPPSNLSGINLAVLRLRSGSLRFRGFPSFNEFRIPVGIVVKPYVERLALVYQNLGNYSSLYYDLPGYTLVAPVLGLLAYDAANISAKNLPHLDMEATSEPISVKFRAVNLPAGVAARCVVFNLDGTVTINDSAPDNVCRTYRQGHFSIVVNSSEISPALAPAPAPGPATVPRSSSARSKKMSKMWKIVGAAVGGLMFLVVLSLLVLCIARSRRKRRVKRMTRVAEEGEILQKRRVGNAQLPAASMIRTKPALEDEQAP